MRNRMSTFALVAAVVVGTLSGMLPALASHAANDFASVSVTEAISGQVNKTFPITVRHAAGTADDPILPGDQSTPAINFVIVTTPPGFRALGATAPAGWTPTIMPSPDGFPRRIQFTGGTIAQNATATFNMITDVPMIGQDRDSLWRVNTASDGGVSGTDEAQASPTLTTKVRVLVAEAVNLVAPPGVVDNIATQEQTATAVCSIRNAGNATRNVAASLTGTGFTVEQSPASKSIAAGASESFTFGIKFGNPGSVNLTCGGTDAAANSSTGPNVATRNVTVQAKRVPTYVANSLSPRAINPNVTGPVDFTLRVNFAGQPAATLNTNLTKFSFCSVVADLISSSSLPAGAQNGFELKFRAASGIPNLPNGSCSTTLNIVGEDENNAVIDFRPVNGTEAIKIDNLIPQVVPTLTAPTTRVPGTADAAKNGDTVSFGGTVKDTNPATGNFDPCGPPSCTVVTDAYTAGSVHSQPVLFQYDGLTGGNEIATPIPVNVGLTSAGVLNGSFNGNYSLSPQTQSVILRVSVQDEAGNRHTNLSGRIQIDNIKPRIVEAAAVRTSESPDGTTVQRTIRVSFSECIGGITSALDWSMEGNVIVDASAPSCGAGGTSTMDLTTARDLLDEGPHGVLSYSFNSLVPDAGRPYDRVGLTLDDQDSNIVDKITPLTPVITRVGGYAAQNGTYTVNSSTSTVRVENREGDYEEQPGGESLGRAVRAGYTIRIAKPDGTVIGSLVATGNTADVPVNLGEIQNGTLDVDIRPISLDAAPIKNSRAGDLVRVILDKLSPTILTVEALASTVRVTFSETIVAGRNASADWVIRLDDQDTLMPTSLTGAGNVRILNMGSGYDPTRVLDVSYLYFGGTGACSDTNTNCRYEDSAKNTVLDQVVTDIIEV